MNKVKAKLEQAGIKHEFTHLPDDISLDVDAHMKFHGKSMDLAMTNMVFKTEKGLVVVQKRGDSEIDSKKLRKLIGIQRLSLASVEDLKSLGLEAGIVPPLGYDAHFYIDQKVLEKDEVYTGTGDRLFTLKLNPNDLVKLNNPIIGNFTKIVSKFSGPKRILTGDRPTGKLHLGHYVGSLKNRVKLQDEYETFLIVADLHTLTTKPSKTDTAQLKENIKDQVLDYLAVGIDPEKVTIYIQSNIPEVAELAVIFGMLTTVPRLDRLPTLKEVMNNAHLTIPSYGLLGYPVLQAADILMVRAGLVPVGKDQASHLEVTREIARSFNKTYDEVLPEPEALIGDVPSLPGIDGSIKMSKSAGNDIKLSDSEAEVTKKVMSMYTDPTRIKPTDPGHVEGNPVFTYLDAFGEDKEKIAEYKDRYQKGTVGDVEVKRYLAEVLNKFLDPIRARRVRFERQPELVEKILREGTKRAEIEAKKTLTEVKKAMKMDYFQ